MASTKTRQGKASKRARSPPVGTESIARARRTVASPMRKRRNTAQTSPLAALSKKKATTLKSSHAPPPRPAHILSDSDNEDSEEDSSGDEGNADLAKLGGKDLRAAFRGEAVSFGTPSAAVKDKRNASHSSSRSSVASSVVDEEEEEEEEELTTPVKPNRHAAARAAEVPVLSTPSRAKQHHEVPLSPVFAEDEEEGDGEPAGVASAPIEDRNAHWLGDTHIVYPAPGARNLSILDQSTIIRSVLDGAINLGIGELLFTDPFLSIEDNYRAHAKIVRRSANDQGYPAIAYRVSHDKQYRTLMAKIVSQRYSNLRGMYKQEAAAIAPLHYGFLGTPAVVQAKRDDLVHDLKYAYAHNTTTGAAILTEPLKHSAIIAMVRHMVFTKKGRGGTVAQRYEHLFEEATVKGVQKRMMPDSLVCLAATMIHAALDDWKNGYHQPSPFSAETYEDVYLVMMEILDTIRERKSGAAYRYLMASIYEEASVGAFEPIITTEDAIKVLDIDGMPTGDDDDAEDDNDPNGMST